MGGEYNGIANGFDIDRIEGLVKPRKNLFNYKVANIGSYVSSSGTHYDNDDFASTEFIEIQANEAYESNEWIRFSCFYDIDKNVVDGGESGSSNFIAPSNAYYIIASFEGKNEELDKIQIELVTVEKIFDHFIL